MSSQVMCPHCGSYKTDEGRKGKYTEFRDEGGMFEWFFGKLIKAFYYYTTDMYCTNCGKQWTDKKFTFRSDEIRVPGDCNSVSCYDREFTRRNPPNWSNFHGQPKLPKSGSEWRFDDLPLSVRRAIVFALLAFWAVWFYNDMNAWMETLHWFWYGLIMIPMGLFALVNLFVLFAIKK